MLISNLDSKKLLKVGDFLGINLITGTNIVSTLFRWIVNTPVKIISLFTKLIRSKSYKPTHKIFNYEFKFNFAPFEFFKRKLLSY